jgi:hypothetical protein
VGGNENSNTPFDEREKKLIKRIKRLEHQRDTHRAKAVAAVKALKVEQGSKLKKHVRVQKQTKRLEKSKSKVKAMVAANKQLRSEVIKLRVAQKKPAYNPQRKGNGKRSWLTTEAKVLTLDGVREGGIAAERWGPLLTVVGKNLSSEPLDLRPASDRTIRRLLAVDDMVWLQKEIEFFAEVRGGRAFQLMCDISPLLKSKFTMPIFAQSIATVRIIIVTLLLLSY